MANRNTTGLTRLGILALPLAGLLVLIGNLVGLGIPDPGTDPKGAAQASSSIGFFLIQVFSNVLGDTLAIFGLFALFAYLVNTRAGRLATLGMVLSVSGLGLFLSFQGVFTYAIPALAREYLNGHQDALRLTGAFFSAKVFAIVILAGLLQFLGLALFGVAIWRSGTLSRWSGVLLGVAGVSLALPVNIPFLNALGALLLVIATGWIALSVLRRPSTPVGTEAQPRVQ